MEMRQYVRVVVERWILVALVTLLGLLGAAAYTFLTPKTYQSEAKLFISVTAVQNNNDANSVYAASQFVLQRITSYTLLADSGQVLGPVITSLGLHETVAQLSTHVSVGNPAQTAFLTVDATDSNPVEAARIANAVADTLSTVIENLERSGAVNSSPVLVTVTTRAVPVSTPISPKPALDLALGFVVGLVLGLGAALLRSQGDTTIRSVAALRELSGAAPLGVFRQRRFMHKSARDAPDQLQAADVEAFRALRTSLALANGGRLPARLAVTSAGPGVGRTMVACNLAIATAEAGTRVCLVEADFRHPRFAQYLGTPHSDGLCAVLVGDQELDDVLIDWSDGPMAVLVAGGKPEDASRLLASEAMTRILDELGRRFELVVLDVPAARTVADALIVARATDGALVVARHGATKRELLRDALAALEAAGVRVFGTALVAVPKREWRSHAYDLAAGSPAPELRGEHQTQQPRLGRPALPQFSTRGPKAEHGASADDVTARVPDLDPPSSGGPPASAAEDDPAGEDQAPDNDGQAGPDADPAVQDDGHAPPDDDPATPDSATLGAPRGNGRSRRGSAGDDAARNGHTKPAATDAPGGRIARQPPARRI
ncbi:MAG: Wzz/FepE/Etk N-terminal domain-containing protein [Jatrophihabitantaceae bacterium]